MYVWSDIIRGFGGYMRQKPIFTHGRGDVTLSIGGFGGLLLVVYWWFFGPHVYRWLESVGKTTETTKTTDYLSCAYTEKIRREP